MNQPPFSINDSLLSYAGRQRGGYGEVQQLGYPSFRHYFYDPLPQAGNEEDVEKYSKRTVRVTREHNEECKRLLRLMGVPVIEAPSEAEAQCAWLNKEGLVSRAP